ncbi:MAG: hypothetical protein HGB05_15765 [Chloroflexi bacterium]|nr:hypothetical protein [Chloroflexota bacterium]
MHIVRFTVEGQRDLAAGRAGAVVDVQLPDARPAFGDPDRQIVGNAAQGEIQGAVDIGKVSRHAGQIDVVLLGMGPDGHTASLFPQHPALAAPADRYAVVVRDAPKPPPTRISLTAAALNCMAHAIFLVAGADKAIKVRAALRGPYDPQSTPAQLVRPAHGEVVWMLDAAAAGEL